MEYRDFEYVLTIYQEKSLSKAAEKLYITQPALSIFLTRLETQLQTRLFERTKRGLVPTYAGQKYIEFARQSIALGHSFDQELCEIQAERKGILRLGTSPHIGSIVLPEMLFSFQNRYPNIQLAITEGTSLTLEKLIDNNELDLALMHLPLLCEHAGYTRVSDDRYVMAIAKDNPLTRKAYSKPGFAHLFLDPALAAEQQFILAHPQQRVRQISDRILRHAGIVPKIRLETSSVQSALCFASNDLGITFAPESYIPLFNVQKELAYFYLEDKYEAFWTFCVAYPQNVTPSTPARFFLQETQRLFGR